MTTPDKWQWVKLGDHVTKVGSGLTPRGGQSVYRQSGIPLIRSQNVHMNRFETEGLAFISPEQDEEMKQTRVQPGDVLLNITGASIGRVCVVPTRICPANVNQHVCIIRSDGTIDPGFLTFFISNPDFQRFIQDSQSGATRQALTKYAIENFRVPYPPLPEQKRIAAILAKADRLRRLRRTARALSDTYLQSVFLEMFGDPVSNPMGWEIKEVETQIKSIRYGTSSPPPYQKDGIPFIRATNVKGGTVQYNKLVYISVAAARSISKCQVRAGDLIVVRSGVNTGDCALIPGEFDGAYAAYDLIVQVEYPKNYYYNSLINSPCGKSIIGPLSRRAGQQHINAEQVKSLSFPVPPISLQQKFARIVHRFERLRAQQREAERQAEHLFQTLLHRAFRGEVCRPS